jgi:hypothetical protein
MGMSRDERSELTRAYGERKPKAGIFLITNTATGKVLLGSSKDLHGPLNKHRFMLSVGLHTNAELQADFRAHGEDAFLFEIAETVKVPEDATARQREDELVLLEQIWLEKIRPTSPGSYNRNERIREW